MRKRGGSDLEGTAGGEGTAKKGGKRCAKWGLADSTIPCHTEVDRESKKDGKRCAKWGFWQSGGRTADSPKRVENVVQTGG